MAETRRDKITETVVKLAFDDCRDMDDENGWLGTSHLLIQLADDIGDTLNPIQLATLIGAAAMAWRRSHLITGEQAGMGGE